MPFPIGLDPRSGESERDFVVHDPFGLRRAITPVFAFDMQDGMLSDPQNGMSVGLGTSFYVNPFGHQLSAMHVTTDFFNARGISIRPGPAKTLIKPDGAWIGIYQDPGLVYGTTRAGELLLVTDFIMFPVDQSKHPLAFTFDTDRLNHVEPALDLIAWDILGLNDRKTVYLPLRIACRPSVAEGDLVMAVGFPEIKSWRRPGAQIVSFQEQMRGSVGRVLKVEREWDQDRKIWPTILVDAHWKPGLSGGPVFNESGEVVGIVSRGADQGEDSQAWGRALWLEALPYRQDIYGNIDPGRPGWVRGWGVCNNPSSLIELFRTQKEAESSARAGSSGLSVRHCSTRYRTCFAPSSSGGSRGPNSP
jgi:serine protease Do